MPEQIPAEVLEYDPFSQWELTVKETFDLKAFYKHLHDFMAHEGWQDLQGGKDNFEIFYQEIHQGGGVFHDIWWRASRKPKNDGLGHIKFYLRLDMKTTFMVKKETIINGTKLNLDNGELRITASFYLDFNQDRYDDRSEWDTHPILKRFKKNFWNRMNKGVSGAAKGELIQASRDIHEAIQTFTGVRPEGEVRGFTPPKGAFN